VRLPAAVGLILLCAGPALLCGAPALGADDAVTAAARFYAVYGSFHPSDGIPDAGGRARYAPVLSDRLIKQLVEASRASDRFNAKNRGSPPMLEGDLFTSQFEGATSWKIGVCSGDARAAHCAVSLRYEQGQPKPVTWTDTIYLVAEQGGWRVDDIGYGAGFAFGNTGRLSETLKTVLRDAQ
jgi:hypothetical protein